MKKLVTALFFIVCAIATGMVVFYYLESKAEQADASRPIAARRLVLSSDAEKGDYGSESSEQAGAANRIGAMANEVILAVESVNLDDDEGEEQILVTRKTNKAEGNLTLVIADYLPDRRNWIRSWEGPLPVTKLTTLQVQAKDLVGDRRLCVVATGMNDANEQTLTVFRMDEDSERTSLGYRLVAGLSGDLVSIAEEERSEGYQLGQTLGKAFGLLVYSRDSESANILDQVLTRHDWDPKKKTYAESSREKIPGATVEKEKIARILTGSAKDFEGFLDGVWYDVKTGPGKGDSRLIVFDRSAQTIVFYSSEAQEVFHWNESHPTRYGLYIGTQNESVSNLRRLMDIELSGADTITLRIFEDLKMKIDAEDHWDGSYRKAAVGASPQAARQQPSFKLEGGYSGQGEELSFEGQRFTRSGRAGTERGGYYLYSIGGDSVLELISLKENGLVDTRKTYKILYAVSRSGKAVKASITLMPAALAITGLELLEERALVLEQKRDN